MTIVTSSSDALIDIIPFDNPKHPRLPSNRFPSGGRAGALTQAARVAWITGKYLYKYRKKWIAGGLALSMTGAALFNRDAVPKGKPTGYPNTFRQTHYRQRRGAKRRRCKCHPNFKSRYR